MPNRGTQFRESEIVIKVKKQNHLEVHYFIKRWTPMRKLKSMFAAEIGININNLCFLFKEHFVAHNDTADTLGMFTFDIIQVFEIELREPGVYGVVNHQ